VLVVGLLGEDVEGEHEAGDGQAEEAGDPVEGSFDDAVPDSGGQEPFNGESGHEKEEEPIGGFDDGMEELAELFQGVLLEQRIGEGGVGGSEEEVDHVDEAEDDEDGEVGDVGFAFVTDVDDDDEIEEEGEEEKSRGC